MINGTSADVEHINKNCGQQFPVLVIFSSVERKKENVGLMRKKKCTGGLSVSETLSVQLKLCCS